MTRGPRPGPSAACVQAIEATTTTLQKQQPQKLHGVNVERIPRTSPRRPPKMILLLGVLQGFRDLGVSAGIELQRLVLGGDDHEARCRACRAQTRVWKSGSAAALAAEALELSKENVKVRLHRGRAMLRRQIFERVGAKTKNAFPFMGERCDRVVRNVLRALANPAG